MPVRKPWYRRFSDALEYRELDFDPWVPLSFAAIAVIGLVVFLWGISDAGDRSTEVLARSKPATGTILDFTDKEALEFRQGMVRYEVGGTTYERRVVIANRKLERGDAVKLRYDPRNPTRVFEEGDRQPPGGEIPAWVGIAFAVAALGFIGAIFSRPRRKRRRKAPASQSLE